MSLPEWQQQGWMILADRNRAVARALVPYLPYSNARLIVNDNTFTVQNICHEITEMLAQYEQQLHIIFAWPLDSIIIDNNDQEELAVKYQEAEQLCSILVQILQTIQAAQPSKYPFVYILTENTQQVTSNTANPLTAPLLGLARSLTLEYPGNGQGHRLQLIDLQPADEHLVPVLAQHLVESRIADHLDEIILRQDNTNSAGSIVRLEWNYEPIEAKQKDSKAIEPQSSTKTIVPFYDADQTPFRLQVAPSRFLADLAWVYDSPLSMPPTTSQIHVRVHSVGLNFRDVLKACGLYPHTRIFAQSDSDQSPNDRDDCLGIDFSGTVVCCSPSSQLKPGDRVFGCSLRGAFHSHLCVEDFEIIRVPSDCKLTYEQLASLPTAFNTALYSLKYRVQLVPEQTVLVHAATGSTGQAFIQYCQSIGAQVLATAGTEEKRRFLREHYGLKHVFNSRDLSFVAEVRKILPNGVDVVVNSLTGPLLQASVELLSTHGHFVELGKRDIFDKNKLSLFNLRRDCSFHVIDLSLVSLGHRRNLSEKIMNDLSKYICSEQFKPIEPITVVEPSDMIDAFTKCNLGKMSGKIIIRLTSSKEPLHLKMKPQLLQTVQNEGQFVYYHSAIYS
jgi:NADPH:quinone reductase-like Zn-dependent oxidoreductase